MRVSVTGGSGFIGSRFIKLFGEKFESVKSLDSKTIPLNDYDKILGSTKNTDILIHTAFDHGYKSNIVGIKNILKACKENGIKKLIHISTVSVYDLDFNDKLDENRPYSKFNDPYSKEKRKIEQEIEKYQDRSFDIVILQPTIVYGLGGNWTKYALHVCKAKEVRLPNNGENICNSVYVDDVASAIYQSCLSNIKYEKILISGDENITWNEFYLKQCKVLDDLALPSNCNIENNTNKNEFHSKNIINFIFILWFKTPLGNIFDLIIGTLKKLRARSYKSTSSDEEMRRFLKSDIGKNILTPLGITKKVHNCKSYADISKAKKLLNYNPKYNFDDGMKNIKDNILKVLK
jgi:nucleoside-diphosphate-sugar epimerase